jgi:hypothetical protein
MDCLCYNWDLHEGKCIGLCELPNYSLQFPLQRRDDERAAAPPSNKVVEPDGKNTPVRSSRRTQSCHRAPPLPINTARVAVNQRWYYEPVTPSTTIALDSSSLVTPTTVPVPRRE